MGKPPPSWIFWEMSISMYRREWPYKCQLEVELACFLHGLSVDDGGLGKVEHFWNVVKILWPEGSMRGFIRNPWSEKMIEEACRWQYLSVSGPASASKTETFALWSIVNFLAAPLETMVLVTSTSLKDSRKRIWGAVMDLWQHASTTLWGKLVDSAGVIRCDMGDGKVNHRAGLALIAGDARREKESIGKLIGIKNKRVFLIGDELPELSPALVEAGASNLSRNDYFQFIGIGNPKSMFDPHGALSKPKRGWKSISPKDTEWETELGYAIRFDSELSPNVLENEIIYSFLPTHKSIETAKRLNGENSLAYWRMCRAFWCPEGSAEGVYSEVDLASADADTKVVRWAGTPEPYGGLDPGFTSGGDATQAKFGLLGQTTDGYQVLLYTDDVLLHEDKDSKMPRNQQIARAYMKECIKRGVTPDHAGYDQTGAGSAFGDILSEIWSPEVCGVYFGGGPSDSEVGVERIPAADKYADRVSELWDVGGDFLRGGQLRGINSELANEMTSRRRSTVKRGDKVLIKVESKKEVRKRTGKSPDLADAAFILLDVCRSRGKFKPQVAQVRSTTKRKKWVAFVQDTDELGKGSALANTQEDFYRDNAGPIVRRRRYKAPQIAGGGWGNMTLLH